MSPLTRTLFALSCAALLYATSASKLTNCFKAKRGHENLLHDHIKQIVPKYNLTGRLITAINIPDECPHWPETDRDTKLVAEEITVCTEDRFKLDFLTSKENENQLSPVHVLCTLTLFKYIPIPCIFDKVPMEVSVTEICNTDWWDPRG